VVREEEVVREKRWGGKMVRGARKEGKLRCKVPKGGPSNETGIPWQPIGVEPIFAKPRQRAVLVRYILMKVGTALKRTKVELR